MGLNKSTGNMYGFVSHTWNPLGGACLHNCVYCSTEKLKRYPVIAKKYRGPVYLVEKEMKTNLGKDRKIFVCAQQDLFAIGVKQEIITKILAHCQKYPDNMYLFQSKNPQRMLSFTAAGHFPKNSWVATTIETNRSELIRKYSGGIPVRQRAEALCHIYWPRTLLTIEPIMAFDLEEMIELINIVNPDMIAIGANTGRVKLPEPSKEDIAELIVAIKNMNRMYFLKDNLRRYL